MTEAALAIDVRGLTKRYGTHTVVDGVDLQIAPGRICGFLGPNGSGKTTTIRMLCGLLTPDAGEGRCLGLDLRREGDAIRRQVGYMTQKFGLYEDLSIRENLMFTARLYELPERAAAVDAALARLGLTDRQQQLAGALSGGWKQRLALAACLLHNPRLLLLDEPTAGVDPKARRDFWDVIHELAAGGVTVLVSTHYMDEAERCHELAYIAWGHLLARGTEAEIIAAAGLVVARLSGAGLESWRPRLAAAPGIVSAAAFGNSVHVAARGHRGGAGQRHARRRVHCPAGGPATEQRVKRFSWLRVAAIFIKECQQMLRDRLTFAMAVGVPILQLVLFGYAINSDPKGLPTALVAHEASSAARAVAAAVQVSGYFRVVATPTRMAEAEALLAAGDVQFIIEIPAGFERQLVRGQTDAAERPTLYVAADATDPAATGGALAALAQLPSVALMHDARFAGAAQAAAPFELRVHRRYNPEGLTRYHIVPGLIGTILTMTMVMLTGLAMTRERERGTMENLLATPVQPLEVMAGKILPYVVIGYVQLAVIMSAAWLLFQVPMQGSFALLMGLIGLFMLANLAVGFTFSTLARNQLQAMQMTFFFFLPSILLSGFMFPFRGMPRWAQVIGEALPLTHFLRIVRGIMLKGSDAVLLWPDIWPLLAFTLVAGAAALLRYRRTLD